MTATASLPSRVENVSITGIAVMAAVAMLLAGGISHTQRALLMADNASFQPKAFAAVVAPLDPKQSQVESSAISRLVAPSPKRVGRATSSARSGLGAPKPVVLADIAPDGFPNPAAENPAFAQPQTLALNGLGNLLPANPLLTDNQPGSNTGAPTSFNPSGAAPAQANNATPGGTTPTGSSSGGGTSGTSTSGGSSSSSSSSGGTTSGGSGTGTTTSSSSSSGGTSGGTGITGGTGNTGTSGTTSGGTGPTGTPAQTAAVPEPATWMTMLLGFGVIGTALRRRQKAHTKSQQSAA